MILRGARVLARCDDAGELVPGADGRVEIRYKPGDARAYRAGERNLEPSDDTRVLAEDTCPPAEDASAAGSGKSASGDKSKAKAAEVARARTHEPDAIIVYADGACSDQIASVSVQSSASMCVDILSDSPLGSMTASPSAYTPGTCTPSGGAMTGPPIADAPTTFCCLPPPAPPQ